MSYNLTKCTVSANGTNFESVSLKNKKIMKGNFNSIINSQVPVLVDFYADWCQPCKIQSPILKQAAEELKDKVKIIKIDVDKNEEIAMRFQIQGVPTLALFKNGSMLWKQSGVQTIQEIRNVVNNHQ
ncbi:MAG: thioredoxin [Bacteroidales bacterium]|nr:thioredoxin [Bacteroidales bacterium]